MAQNSNNLRIEDIAAACGVSPATVSNVLNNRTEMMSATTRERVLDTVRKMNYRPRALSSGSRSRSSNTIGVMTVKTDLTDADGFGYLNRILAGIVPAAMQAEHFITIYGDIHWPDMHQALRTYCDGRCEGMIVVTPPTGSEFVRTLYDRGIPFVVVTEAASDVPQSTVDIDNEQCAADMVAYLHGLGHRRIAYFEGSEEVATCWPRHKGFLRGMAERALDVDLRLIFAGEYNRASGYGRAARLWGDVTSGALEAPTAIFCSNDSSAFGAIEALQERGVRVPGDVSVVGFDDIPEAERFSPALTTVRQPLAEMGAEAVRLLLRQLAQEQKHPVTIRLPAEIVARNSARPPAQEGTIWSEVSQ